MNCKNCGYPVKPSALFCTSCGAKVEKEEPAVIVCPACGKEAAPGARFCTACGSPFKQPQCAETTPQAETVAPPAHTAAQEETPPAQPAPPTYVQPPQYQYQPPREQYAPPMKAKRKPVLLYILIILIVLAGAAAGGYFGLGIGRDAFSYNDEIAKIPAVSYKSVDIEPTVEVSYEYADIIYPALYRTMDSVVALKGTCYNGEADTVLRVEIPGFTQPYEQSVHLNQQETHLEILPPLATGELGLNSSKSAQIVISLKDAKTGEYYIQDSKSIQLMSKYDLRFIEEDASRLYYENILAWMTPESQAIVEFKRAAISALEEFTNGAMNAFPGYQKVGGFTEGQITYLQAYALQYTMAEYYGVRYNASPFTMSGSGAQQRVLLPEDVLRTASGLCVETSLVIASALQSANMHVALVFPPGHCQVAVETWTGTGEYFLIETTELPPSDYCIKYLTKEEWKEYIADCIVLDCDLVEDLGIKPLSN